MQGLCSHQSSDANRRGGTIFSKFEIALPAHNFVYQQLWPLEQPKVHPTDHRFPCTQPPCEHRVCSRNSGHKNSESRRHSPRIDAPEEPLMFPVAALAGTNLARDLDPSRMHRRTAAAPTLGFAWAFASPLKEVWCVMIEAAQHGVARQVSARWQHVPRVGQAELYRPHTHSQRVAKVTNLAQLFE